MIKEYINKSILEADQQYIAHGVNCQNKMGSGLAGGNWDIISQIIDDATGDDLDVYVYYL